jgi:N-acetylglutamate synthase-like GNAT family acetyltransferase
VSRAIREATQDDVPALMDLLRLMHDENGMAPIDVAKVLNHVLHVLRDGRVLVAEIDGRIVGSLGLELKSWWYSQASFIGDHWFFVSPNHRTSSAAIDLVNAARRLSKRAAVPLLLGVLTPADTERKNLFFRRKFPTLKPVGELFIEGA